jgi:hypothetical protein
MNINTQNNRKASYNRCGVGQKEKQEQHILTDETFNDIGA